MLHKLMQRRGVRAFLAVLVIAAFLVGAGFSGVLWGRAPATVAAASSAPAYVAQAGNDPEALADLYERVLPSVVNIQVTKSVSAEEMPLFPGLPQMPEMPVQGEGSGWVYDAEGYIVTNNHVVEGADEVIVTFANGMWTTAEVVATDPQSDLAVLKVEAPKGVELKPLPLAEPNSLRVGHTVIAIGNPFGLEGTMTTGIVSALGRSFPIGEATGGRYTLPDVIQTDAAINPGNSGGPLLNLAGEVVGVNFAIESPVRASSGVGFAIPVAIVKRVIPALITDGRYAYAYLGISGNSITPQLAKLLDIPENTLGAYVGSVTPNGPAAKAGLRGGTRAVRQEGVDLKAGGDIIIAIDGNPVRQFNDLVSFLVTKATPGQKVTLTILRDGKEQEIEVTLGERPKEAPAPERGTAGNITPRAAVAIARDAVETQGALKGRITSTVVTPDERDGDPVWVVELSDGEKTATVIVHAHTGEVLDLEVK